MDVYDYFFNYDEHPSDASSGDDELGNGGASNSNATGNASAATPPALRVCKYLSHCSRLAHLELDLWCGPPLHALLAAIGTAVGARLQSLTISTYQLPPTPADAEGALMVLAESYPCLEVLVLQLTNASKSYASVKALTRALMLPVPALAALCPALREVRVEPESRFGWTGIGIQEAVWLRPKA